MRIQGPSENNPNVRSSPISGSPATSSLNPTNKNKLVALKSKIPTLTSPTARPSTQVTPPSNRATALTGALAHGILRQTGMLKVRNAVEEAARSSIRGQSAGTSRPLQDRVGAPVGTTYQPRHPADS